MTRSPFFSTLAFLLALLVMATSCQAATPSSPATPSLPAPTATQANTIRLTNGEWPPYMSEELPYYGLASRIVSEAFALKGIKVEYGFFPWARALQLAQNGDWDGSVMWNESAERDQYFYFSTPVFEERDVFFHLKSYAFDWKEIKDLAGIHIGGTIDYDYGKAFMQAEQANQISVERVSADDQNFKKLLAGRIDIFPVDLEVGLSILHKSFTPEEMAQITYHPLPVNVVDNCLILSKKVARNKELVTLFNAGLDELKASGRLQQIINESHQEK